MPQIPGRLDRTVPQSRRPIVRASNVEASNAAIDAAGMVGRGVQNLASGIGSQATAMQRAQDALDENDYYDAKGKFLQAKVEQDNAYDQDPDWGTYTKRYGENLGRVRSDLGATIKNGKLRRRFEQETNLDLAEGSARLKAKAWDRETKDGVDNLNLAVTDGVSTALKARDEKTRATILQGINARIDAAAKAQYITVPGSKELKRKVAQSYAVQRYDLMRPEAALAELVPGAAPPKPGITQIPLPSPEIANAVKGAPKEDQAILARIAELESKGNPNAINPLNPDVVGLFQISSKTAEQYGLKDRNDPKASAEMTARLLDDNRKSLRGALNREPTPAELYLAHQQGAGGAAALLGNPDQPAIVALVAGAGVSAARAKQSILDNGGTENMTAGQFVSLWENKFNGGDGAPIGRALVGEIPEGGWDFSQPNGTPADVLDPSTRADLIAKYAKAMQDQSKAAREAVQVSVSVEADDANQNAYLNGKTDPNFEAKIMAAYPDERGAKMLGEYRSNAQAGADNNLIKGQSITDDMAMLAGAEQAAMQAGPGSADAAKRYGRLAAEIKQKHDALTKDPAQYVIDNDPGAADAFSRIQNMDPKDPEGVMRARLAAETIVASQRKLGLGDGETRILPKDTALTIANSIEPKDGQSGEEAVANIQAQAEQWGPYWPKVWSEIAGNVGDAGRVVATMDPSQSMAAARLIEANRQKEVLEKQTSGTVGTDIKENIDSEFADFMETFAHGGSTAEGLRYRQQAEILARDYVVRGAQPDAAAKRAYKEIIDTAYDVTAGVRIPKKFDVEDVVSGADMAVRNIQPTDIDPVQDDLGAGADAQNQYLASIKNNHRWVNSPDGRGLALLDPYDRPVLKSGKPFTVTFDDLAKQQATKPIFRGMGQR